MHKLSIAATTMAAAFILACDGNSSKLAASGSGDLSNAPALRTQADSAILHSCGNGQALSDSVFRRRPYVQQITEQNARVLFTARQVGSYKLQITRPDGTLVSELEPKQVPNLVAPGPATQYEARIEGLTPGTIYCYSLPGFTERAGFQTAPTAQTEHVRFVAFGDSGTGDSYQRAVARQMQTVAYDLVLHMGDVAYGSGHADELEKFFFDVYPTMTRSFAVFPAFGNHDYKTDDAAPLRNAFVLPENALPGFEERYYSFDWGNAHFVALDTERMSVEQANWLDADLNANQRDWVIVFGHRPPYSSGEHGSDHTFRKFFGPILEKHQVPLVLSGHEHDYERTRPIAGVTYVVTGGGGRETRDVGESDFTAYSEDVLHFVYVEISGKELVLHAIDGVGREFDGARIQRG